MSWNLSHRSKKRMYFRTGFREGDILQFDSNRLTGALWEKRHKLTYIQWMYICKFVLRTQQSASWFNFDRISLKKEVTTYRNSKSPKIYISVWFCLNVRNCLNTMSFQTRGLDHFVSTKWLWFHVVTLYRRSSLSTFIQKVFPIYIVPKLNLLWQKWPTKLVVQIEIHANKNESALPHDFDEGVEVCQMKTSRRLAEH